MYSGTKYKMFSDDTECILVQIIFFSDDTECILVRKGCTLTAYDHDEYDGKFIVIKANATEDR